MKKTVIITTILCTGLLIGKYLKQTIHAEDLEVNNSFCEVIDLNQEDDLNVIIKDKTK